MADKRNAHLFIISSLLDRKFPPFEYWKYANGPKIARTILLSKAEESAPMNFLVIVSRRAVIIFFADA